MGTLAPTTRLVCLVSLLVDLGLVTSGCSKPCKDLGLYVVPPDGTSNSSVSRPGPVAFGALQMLRRGTSRRPGHPMGFPHTLTRSVRPYHATAPPSV